MRGVFIVPTGIGCEIGGHAGDANPAAKLIASVCDELIVHPNVVNASDINEMADNMLYVDGYMLDYFLQGFCGLKRSLSNKILVAVNKPIRNETINAVNAARITIGADIKIIELEKPIMMEASISEEGNAIGTYSLGSIFEDIKGIDFDALAVTSPIEVEKEVARGYLEKGGVNPWGAVEALLSRQLSEHLSKPVAHAPMGNTLDNFNNVVDPRMAPELVSICYLHCVLKGLHKAPRECHHESEHPEIHAHDLDFMISPCDCWGPPHEACIENDIPIIMVEENRPAVKRECGKHIKVKNYLEAAGYISCMKSGLSIQSVTRPIKEVEIIRKGGTK